MNSDQIEQIVNHCQETAHHLERARAKMDHLIDDYMKLISQRDVLLAACKAALGAIEPCKTFEGVRAQVAAAIAKAEGQE